MPDAATILLPIFATRYAVTLMRYCDAALRR